MWTAAKGEATHLSRRGVLGMACALILSVGIGGRPAQAEELRVGIAPIYPPLAFKADGQLRGMEVDFAHRLAKELGVTLKFVELPWDELIPALEDRRVDMVMSGMSITPERKKRVSFVRPYLRVGQMALIRRGDYDRLSKPGAMDEPTSRVGFLRGTTSEAYAREHLKRATLQGFADLDPGIEALRQKEIDFFIADAPIIWKVRGGLESGEKELKGLYTPLTEEYLAWAVRQDNTALRDRLNAVVSAWQKNGTIETIEDRWITVRRTAVSVKGLD
jgi:ABC-type amino acid transport substrate-binding protein